MTILEKIKFEEDWLSEVNLTMENIRIAFAGIRATVLEQEPCEDLEREYEKSKALFHKVVAEDDCISREAVLNLFNNDFRWETDWIRRKIEKLPSVTPTRPHGNWIINKDKDTVCSNCEEPIFKYQKIDFDYRPHFCPNCGADMRGDADERTDEPV